VQASRLADGQRKITSIAEISLGLDGDQPIATHEIFRLPAQGGMDPEGKILGEHQLRGGERHAGALLPGGRLEAAGCSMNIVASRSLAGARVLLRPAGHLLVCGQPARAHRQSLLAERLGSDDAFSQSRRPAAA
jgi:hypothetical protein